MKKRMFWTAAAVVAVIGLLAFAACGNGNNTGGNDIGGNPQDGGLGPETDVTASLILESGSKPQTRDSYAGRSNVLQIDGKNTLWDIVRYPLTEYKGKEITIELQADVRREGAADGMGWQVNNNGTWPAVTSLQNALPGQWHAMKGRLIVIPSNTNPFIYLSNWGGGIIHRTRCSTSPTSV